MRARVLVFIAVLTLASGAEAQTMRNPPGATPPSGTTRNPSGPAKTTSGADRDGPGPGTGTPTRPPLGSEPSGGNNAVGRATTAPGHTLGVGPNEVGNNGTGGGGGSPGVINPAGAGGGASPGPLGAARPNGGSPTNGSKASPMRANGVRKVQ